MSLCFSVILHVGTLKLIHEVVWSHVAILSSLTCDSLLHLFVYFNLMLMHVSSVVSDLHEHMDCSLPGSSVHGILQTRILEWVDIFPSGDFLDPGIEPASPASPALAGGFLTAKPPEPLGKAERNGTPIQYSGLENPMNEDPCRLQSMGSLRVRHD